MATYADWRELGKDFKELGEREPEMRAEWYDIDSRWLLRGSLKGGHLQFDPLARRAAIYAGQEQIKEEKARDWWLDHLKSYIQEHGNEQEYGNPQDFQEYMTAFGDRPLPGKRKLRRGELPEKQRLLASHGKDVTIYSVSHLSAVCCDEWANQALFSEEARRRKNPGKKADPQIRDRRRSETKKTGKRAMSEDVAARRGLVQAFARANPNLKGKNLNAESCVDLDRRRVALPPAWRAMYKIKTWKEGYQHDHVKGLIQRMFSNDRKISL